MKVEKLGVILSKSSRPFESAGVLNPATYQDGNTVKMLYRAFKEGNFSTVGYAEFSEATQLSHRAKHPVIFPEEPYEEQGVEDPRMVKIEDTYYVTYTGYNGYNAVGCLATSKDLLTYKKHGVITPPISLRTYQIALENSSTLNPKYMEYLRGQMDRGMVNDQRYLVWDKDIVLFPEKIGGQYFMLHRLLPGIQWVKFNSFDDLTKGFWEEYIFDLEEFILMDPLYDHENMHIGAGAAPLRTPEGWLIIYHSVQTRPFGRAYHAAAALLDLEDPTRVICRMDQPLFSPTEDYEKSGYVNNVCFPTGTAIYDDWLYIYYGAADDTIAAVRVRLNELIDHLLSQKDVS